MQHKDASGQEKNNSVETSSRVCVWGGGGFPGEMGILGLAMEQTSVSSLGFICSAEWTCRQTEIT